MLLYLYPGKIMRGHKNNPVPPEDIKITRCRRGSFSFLLQLFAFVGERPCRVDYDMSRRLRKIPFLMGSLYTPLLIHLIPPDTFRPTGISGF